MFITTNPLHPLHYIPHSPTTRTTVTPLARVAPHSPLAPSPSSTPLLAPHSITIASTAMADAPAASGQQAPEAPSPATAAGGYPPTTHEQAVEIERNPPLLRVPPQLRPSADLWSSLPGKTLAAAHAIAEAVAPAFPAVGVRLLPLPLPRFPCCCCLCDTTRNTSNNPHLPADAAVGHHHVVCGCIHR